MRMSLLTVVVPCYNEELNINQMVSRISETMEGTETDLELLFVDDGSSDKTWNEIRHIADRDNRVRGVRFSRNFGKEAAIFAGLSQARGDAVAVMDSDLQHPPETLVKMLDLWKTGVQVVEGVKKDRGRENGLYKGFSGLFYRLMSRFMNFDMENTSDFKLLDRKVVDAILSMPERNMFFRATSVWVGFRSAKVSYEVQLRNAGTSKWSTWDLIKYAVHNITSFTAAPLQFVTLLGGICFAGSLVLTLYSLIMYFRGKAVEGYSTMLIVMLMIGSAIMLSLGIIGSYIARIYEEVKKRPRFLISEVCGGPDKAESAGTRAETRKYIY